MQQGPTTYIEGAEKLVALYGYWLSFHDAALESVLIERAGPTVTLALTTRDAVSADQGESFDCESGGHARVVLRWHGVQDLALAGVDADENNWIGGLEFVQSGDAIQTEIRQMDGTHGFILAERVEVVRVEPVE